MKLNPYDMMKIENRKTNGLGMNINPQNQINPLKNALSKPSDNKASAVEKALSFRQITLNSEEIKSVNQFVSEAKGSLDNKLDTIEIANNKGIALTTNNLNAMHMALNDKLTIDQDMITQFSEEEMISEDDIKEVPQETPLEATIEGKRSSSEGVEKNESNKKISDYDRLKDKLKSTIRELDMSDDKKAELINKLEDKKALKSVIKDIVKCQMNERGEKANDSIVLIKSITTLAQSSHLPEQEVQLILDNINEALEDIINHFHQDMTGDNVFGVELKASDIIQDFYEEQDAQLVEWMMSIAEIKLYMVSEVTEEMAQVKESFDQFQNETLSSINHIVDALENVQSQRENWQNIKHQGVHQQQEKQAVQLQEEQVKKYMSQLIKKMNRTIMRTSLTLYTDMKTEKALLKMSTELEKAQACIEKGKMSDGLKLIKEVGKTISDIKFNPERQKIKAVAQNKVKETLALLKGEEKDQTVKTQEIEKQMVLHEHYESENVKAKAVLEMVRQWGLNNEVELAKAFDKNVDPKFSELASDNIKQMLMKMADEAVEKRQVENIENALMNLNGQQMLNDENPKGNGQQSKYFNLPYKKGHKIKNMKVFMNGKERHASMDYNNCKLYFGIETEKFGPIGMKLVTVDGKLNFEINSEDKSHEKLLKEVVSEKMQSLIDCGFEKGDIKYKTLSGKEQNDQGKALLKANAIKRHQVIGNQETYKSASSRMDVQL